mgnify:CR=1 FL=1
MQGGFEMDKTKSQIIKKLKQFKRQNNIDKVYWFGSRVGGMAHRWSDIDLVVVSKSFRGKGLLQRAPPLHLKWDLNYPVDLLCYTPREFNRLKKQITLVRQAVKEGIEI